MYRKLTDKLCDWFKQGKRQPLVLRGARQIGKTWLVRDFAEKLKLDLVELNFESDPSLKTLFRDNNPQKTLLLLEAQFNKNINRVKTVLFLDEIQAAPELLSKLRWFAESMPELAIIATGSLLDFAIAEHEFSMPVGRINYMYMEPMSFEEFLLAKGQTKLYEFLASFQLGEQIPEVIHKRFLELLREYIIIGGMPAAINCWIRPNSSLAEVNKTQQNILQAYRDDFSKYAKKIASENLESIFKAIPRLLGKKFKYSLVDRSLRQDILKTALNLLCRARICHKVVNSAANGVPLGAEVNQSLFKVIFLDIGLVSVELGLSLVDVHNLDELKLVNEGGVAEQLIGQMLRTVYPYYLDPRLYYWVREKTGAESEVDYLVQHNTRIVPIEVKAGTTGTLRSLHTFMHVKGLNRAIRFNADYPSIAAIKIKNHVGELVEYELISLPLYLVEQVYRFI